MLPSFLCFVPPFVDFLGLTTPQILNPDPRPPVFKPDWCRCTYDMYVCIDVCLNMDVCMI